MSANTLFILGLVLFDGVAVGWGVWQYWTVRPSKTKDEAPATPAPTLKQGARHPEGQHGSDQG